MAEKPEEEPEDKKDLACATCAPFAQAGTWRCSGCGAMNISKWKECWKCKSPRAPDLAPPLPADEGG